VDAAEADGTPTGGMGIPIRRPTTTFGSRREAVDVRNANANGLNRRMIIGVVVPAAAVGAFGASSSFPPSGWSYIPSTSNEEDEITTTPRRRGSTFLLDAVGTIRAGAGGANDSTTTIFPPPTDDDLIDDDERTIIAAAIHAVAALAGRRRGMMLFIAFISFVGNNMIGEANDARGGG
jgi:hypothetical protein